MNDLTQVKAGDKVALQNRNDWGLAEIRAKYTIQTVERMTATQLVLNNGARVYKVGGAIVGNPYRSYCVATPEILVQVAEAQARASRYYGTQKPLDELAEALRSCDGLNLAEREKLAAFWAELRGQA
jgi:hypothetical protein